MRYMGEPLLGREFHFALAPTQPPISAAYESHVPGGKHPRVPEKRSVVLVRNDGYDWGGGMGKRSQLKSTSTDDRLYAPGRKLFVKERVGGKERLAQFLVKRRFGAKLFLEEV